MVSCLGELHIWTLKNQTIVSDSDIGCFTYHDKTEVSTTEHPHLDEKAVYTEGRNVTWAPRNKRPDKVKEAIKEVEDLLSSHRCVKSKWLSRRLLQMFLNNGAIVTFVVSIHTGDVDRIFIDRSLVTKLSSDCVSDVLWTDSYIAVVYSDKARLDYFHFTRRPATDAARKFEKVSSYEPRLLVVELPGPVGRRLDRQLICSLRQDWVVCWWPLVTGEAMPWSPMTSDKDKANMVLFLANGASFNKICHHKTECDLVGICFSMMQQQQLLTVEQSAGAGGEMSMNTCVYEQSHNKIRQVSLKTLPLRSRVVCYDRTTTEDKLIVGCEDGTIMIYDEYKKITHISTGSLIPSRIKWHPSSVVFIVASARAEIQVYDLALAMLPFQLVAENPSPTRTLELAPYFRSAPSLQHMHWSPMVDQQESKMPECNDSLFLMFERGPMVLLQYYLGVFSNGTLSPLALVNQYIKSRAINQAIGMLNGLNWNVEGKMCYACLSAIFNHLLRMPLNAEREAQLESVLGAFYAPPRPLSEVTILDYRDPISKLARRFFHHLLRFARFEKAFLLAVDIGSRDLFMDIHYVARDKGETALAEVARRKADQIDTEALATDRVEEEYSQSDGSDASYSGSDEECVDSHPPQRPPRHDGSSAVARKPPAPPPPTSVQRAAASSYQSMVQDARFVPPHYMAPTRDPPQAWQRQPYVDSSEAVLQDLERQLASQLEDEYTDALLDEHILPPPPSHADSGSSQGDGDRVPSSVKVIHFGVV